MLSRKKVLLAMSGGVDSSVAAILLRDMGFEVIGITFPTWTTGDDSAVAFAAENIDAARAVAKSLGIQHLTLNCRNQFENGVVKNFVRSYLSGLTPNPCVTCNSLIKLGVLLDRMHSLGCDWIATGHYARTLFDRLRQRYLILRGTDETRDQSYFLHTLKQEQIQHLLLPLANFSKEMIRSIAAERNLPHKERPESQDICFVPQGRYADFIEAYTGHPASSGDIVDTNGRVLGQHEGIIRYTIGQRKKLGIAATEALYVLGIDPERNTVIVGPDDLLWKDTIQVTAVNWISFPKLLRPINVNVVIRHRGDPVEARLYPVGEDDVRVELTKKVRAITPGQSAVFYLGDELVGGGQIRRGYNR